MWTGETAARSFPCRACRARSHEGHLLLAGEPSPPDHEPWTNRVSGTARRRPYEREWRARIGRDPALAESIPLEQVPAAAAGLAAAGERDAIRLRARLRLEPGQLQRWPTLSPGERKRWQVGAALFAAPDLLLCDEPTNHLDADGRGLLIGALRRHRRVGLVVSHDRGLLDELTRGTLRVRDVAVDVVAAPYSRARRVWADEAAAAAAARDAAESRLAAARRRADAARREQAGATRMRSTGRA